ncbi:MAG: hypothetical protein ACK47B_04990 [Armatimonadota bacterium]
MALGAVLGVAGYWAYCQGLPANRPPAVRMPSPNAYDDYVAAAALLPPRFQTVNPSDPSLTARDFQRWSQRVQPALRRLRAGFRHEYLNPPARSFSHQTPELMEFRRLERALLIEGRAGESRGRWNAAAQSYLDCLRLGGDVPRGGIQIHGLVGIAVEREALAALNRVADRLDANTARDTLLRLRERERRSTALHQVLASDRDYQLSGTYELLEARRGSHRAFWEQARLRAPGAPSNTFRVPPGAWEELRFGFTPKGQILYHYRAYYDALIAEARKPYAERAALPPVPDDPFNRLLLPSLSDLSLQWAKRDADYRVALARLALRCYELDSGQPPTTLQALVPRYLPAVPEDPFGGGVLVFNPDGVEAQVYSRGPDGNDDGGRSPRPLLRGQAEDGDITGASRRR